MPSWARSLIGLLLATGIAACFVVRGVTVETVDPERSVGSVIDAPTKAFLANGEIVVFPPGARVTRDEVVGRGIRYSIDLREETPVTRLPLDSVVGIEAFDESINPTATVLASIGATALVGLGAFAIACAADPKCFGSCPTIYAWENGEEVLEAEAFSYSIAPLLEGRDVDPLGVQPDADGLIRLELRNEALETHYINHLELLQVNHPKGRRALVDEGGRLVTVGAMHALEEARDRDGVSLRDEMLERDGIASRSTQSRLESVTEEDFQDHVELRFPAPEGESPGLVLRMRNSLLNSVLFYDLMLGSRGAEALNWLGQDIQRIGEAVQLGRWFQETMGLRIDIRERGEWREVARIPDTGPIAWDELVIRLPEVEGPHVDVRLRFLVDHWRIDYAALAEDVQRAESTVLPMRTLTPLGRGPDASARQRLAEPDDDYLVTAAATAFALEFEPEPSSSERTFFLSSQGYYTEWIRPEWIRTGKETEPFRPNSGTVVELVDQWMAVKDDFEARFFETRIPVR